MSVPYRIRVAVIFLVALFAAPLYLRADERAAPASATTPALRQAAMAEGFLRFVDATGPAGARLETSDVTYRNADGVTVRLVSAVHIGEKAYFEALRNSFTGDDAVLYELVKPKDAGVPVPGVAREGGSGVGEFQRVLKDVLNLDFQLDTIDYTAKNFVHADLDAETFRKLQEERGETFEMLFIKQLMKSMTQPPPGADALQEIDAEQMLREMIRLVTLPDSERRMKLMLARQMVSVEAGAAGFFGDPDNNVIVTERNKAAMNVLSDTIASGKKKISVFYGAAHMPDFAKRLEALGFKPVATEWRMAWDLKIRDDKPSALEELIVEGIKALSEEQMEHLEGRQSVLAALKAGKRKFQAVLLSHGAHLEKLQDLLAVAAERGVPVRQADSRELDALAHGATHGGVLAVCTAKPRTTPDELLDLVDRLNGPALLLLLEGVEDARNLGFTFRSAEALGVHAVLVKKHLWDLDPVEVARPSSGAYERLPLVQLEDVGVLRQLQRRGLRIFGCVAGANRSIYQADLAKPAILAVGGEKRGLSGAVRSICDRFVSIPTVGDATSLSLSHASAIIMAEAMRQRLPPTVSETDAPAT